MLQREFTLREKILILILAILLLCFLYYNAVYKTTLMGIDEAKARLSQAELDLETETVKLQKMEQMKAEMENLDSGHSGAPAAIPDYDNIQPLMKELNGIVAKTNGYSIAFGQLSFEGNYVRRPLSMSFESGSYAAAVSILKEIKDNPYRVLIQDISISPQGGSGLKSGPVSVSLSLVFFELSVAPAQAVPEGVAPAE